MYLPFGILDSMFKGDTAHQSAAHAGYLDGVDDHVLIPGHPDRYRFKLHQECGTAEGPPAKAVATEHPGTVPDAHLSHLYPCLVFIGEVLDKLPEINAAVGRKVEDHLTLIKGIFYIDELHRKPPVIDASDAIGVGLLFHVGMFFQLRNLLLRRDPQHLL